MEKEEKIYYMIKNGNICRKGFRFHMCNLSNGDIPPKSVLLYLCPVPFRKLKVAAKNQIKKIQI